MDFINRLEEERFNYQGCLMKIIEYNNSKDIIVEFKDKYKARVHSKYCHFALGRIKNPYYPNVWNVGIVGNKYPITINGKMVKEYAIWKSMLQRCFDENNKKKNSAYKDVTCHEEWLLYENFYEWLHNQENFEKWLNGDRWAIDKDILIKGNKVYSPEACCLVPQNVNSLFINNNKTELPIGVHKHKNKFTASYHHYSKSFYTGIYETIEEAFYSYKQHKENIIKQVAQEEYNKGNITKRCFDAMINYQVEITD